MRVCKTRIKCFISAGCIDTDELRIQTWLTKVFNHEHATNHQNVPKKNTNEPQTDVQCFMSSQTKVCCLV